jgi:hypothetical protein
MTAVTAIQLLDRVKSATPESPIAVFKIDGTRKKVEAIFADTYYGDIKIKTDPNFIGVFNQNQDPGFVRRETGL